MDNPNKKILIATGIFPPDIGGPATYASTLLAELPKRGFDVKIVTYAESACFKEDESGRLTCISRKQGLAARYLKYFFAVYRMLGWADTAYLMGPVSEGFPAMLACILRRKKYYLKVVGDYAWEQMQAKSKVNPPSLKLRRTRSQKSKVNFVNPDDFQLSRFGIRIELLRLIEHIVARNAKEVITPSHYLKKIVAAWGVPESRIRVIYNSVKPIAVKQGKLDSRRELGIDGRILLSAGRLVPWKGFGLLISLLPDLLEKYPDIKLYIAGDGPDRARLEKAAGGPELKDRVVFLGSLKQEELWRYMSASDIFVLNTGYEGLSHILIEALMAGTPVVTTDIGGNPELIENGKNGILVEYDDRNELMRSIIRLLDDGKSAEEYIKAGERTAGNFTKEKMLDDLVAAFDANG